MYYTRLEAPPPPIPGGRDHITPYSQLVDMKRCVRYRDVLEQVKKAILARGGANGIQGISRMMRIMDDSGDKRLSRDEFKFGLRDYGVDCSDSDVDSLLCAFDTDGDGFISFDEFLVALRGDISPRRLQFIDMAFQKLDKSKDGRVTIDDLRTVYDVSKHPEFIQGKQTADQILSEFLRQWDTVDHDGVVTYDEFVTYYRVRLFICIRSCYMRLANG
ncbi:hypothetical protein AaE_001671 [Aphanomyces astaci]|uniref:EF-hand domain-containing protein n=1 Tax=Aphanomyces astaci TaxID=112090 RepID=A0A6A5AVY5_APHAT|nr:hypothetical protein AaE_001671 [Aphanomyces astaci]